MTISIRTFLRSSRGLRATLAVALAAALAPLAAQADPVRLGGTGSALATMAQLAQAYRTLDPSFQLEVVPNLGSGGGLKALAAGSVQLAVASRALKPEEAAAGLRAVEYGRTPFLIATTKAGVTDLTRAQIADLYAGRTSHWADGQPVRLVLRPASDGDSALLASLSPEIKSALATAMAREGMVTGMTDQDAVDAIERLPGGLGTASLALLQSERRRAHPVSIDGIAPTPANVLAGRYPYVKQLYVVTRVGAPASVAGFVAFIGSEAGRRVLADTGHAVAPAGTVTASAAPQR